MKLLLLSALAASLCLSGHTQSTRTCNLHNGNNGCLKYDELTSWLQFCPYYGEDSNVDGTDIGCIAIKPLRISETSSSFGEIPLRDSASGLRLRPDGGASITRFDKNCSTSPYLACLPDDGSQAPLIAYTLPLRMDLPQGGSVRLKTYIFGSSGVLQYGTVRHAIARNSFKFDISCDSYVFQNQGADGVSIDFLVRDKGVGSNGNTAVVDGDCGCVSVNQMSIVAPQWFTFTPVDGISYTTPTTPATSLPSIPTTDTANQTTSNESLTSASANETFTDFTPNATDVPPLSTDFPSFPSETGSPPVTTLFPATTLPPVTTLPPATTVPIVTPPRTTTILITRPPVTTTTAEATRRTVFPPFTLFPQAEVEEQSVGRRLLQAEPESKVLWGTAQVNVRIVSGQQSLSFSFTGPFTAFHYDPFVGEADWDMSHVTNGASTVGAMMAYSAVISIFIATLTMF